MTREHLKFRAALSRIVMAAIALSLLSPIGSSLRSGRRARGSARRDR